MPTGIEQLVGADVHEVSGTNASGSFRKETL
jgi:hypothetical protein